MKLTLTLDGVPGEPHPLLVGVDVADDVVDEMGPVGCVEYFLPVLATVAAEKLGSPRKLYRSPLVDISGPTREEIAAMTPEQVVAALGGNKAEEAG